MIELGKWQKRGVLWGLMIFVPFIVLTTITPMITKFVLTGNVVLAIFVLSIISAVFFLGLGKKKFHAGVIPLYGGMVLMFIGFGAFYGAMDYNGITYDFFF